MIGKKREYRYEWDILYVKCRTCGEWKTTDYYHKATRGKFWIITECKECVSKRQSVFYKENRDRKSRQWRQYYRDNKEKISEHKKEYREHNKEKFDKSLLTEKLWFNRQTFHEKARAFTRKYWLKPEQCGICKSISRIEIHHPSYETFDKWSEVVFCCKSCHQRIHAWTIECPEPINLKTFIL